MIPCGIRIGKDKLNVLAYGNDIVQNGKTDIEIR
jgi:hypothetical protein